MALFKTLQGKDLDPDVNHTMSMIQPEVANYLSGLISDVNSKTERVELMKKLKNELVRLIKEKMKFDLMIKQQLAIREANKRKAAKMGTVGGKEYPTIKKTIGI